MRRPYRHDQEAFSITAFGVMVADLFTVFALGMAVVAIAIWEFNAGE